MESLYKFLSQFVTILVIFSITGSHGTITNRPQNSAFVVGQTTQAVLSCTTNATLSQWSYTPVGGSSIPITTFVCVVNSGLNYAVNKTSAGQCDLIFTNPSTADAGVYSCTDDGTIYLYAYVVILSSSPTCGPTTVSNIVVGNAITMSCQVGYSGTSTSLYPVMAWSGCVGTASSPPANGTSAWSTYTVNATKPYLQVCNCTTTFTGPVSPPANYATNTPSYNNVCTTSNTIQVQYPVTNAVISQSAVNPGGCSSVTYICTADSNPMYTCQFMITNTATSVTTSVTSSCSLTWSTPGNYSFQCVASNVIRGTIYSTTSNSLFFQPCATTTAATTTTLLTTTTPSSNSSPNPSEVTEECTSCSCNVACIVPAIVVPISVAIITVILVVAIVRVKTAKPNHKHKPVSDHKSPVYVNVIALSSNNMNEDQTASNYEELDHTNWQTFSPPVYTSLIAKKEDGTRTVSANLNQLASNYEELNHNTRDDSTPYITSTPN